jgi:hypothetical protein
MKKVALIALVGAALLVLATGAWVADGAKAVRRATRRRRADGSTEHRALVAEHLRHPVRFVRETPDRLATA